MHRNAGIKSQLLVGLGPAAVAGNPAPGGALGGANNGAACGGIGGGPVCPPAPPWAGPNAVLVTKYPPRLYCTCRRPTQQRPAGLPLGALFWKTLSRLRSKRGETRGLLR